MIASVRFSAEARGRTGCAQQRARHPAGRGGTPALARASSESHRGFPDVARQLRRLAVTLPLRFLWGLAAVVGLWSVALDRNLTWTPPRFRLNAVWVAPGHARSRV